MRNMLCCTSMNERKGGGRVGQINGHISSFFPYFPGRFGSSRPRSLCFMLSLPELAYSQLVFFLVFLILSALGLNF